MNIILIGMPGSGKTTMAVRLRRDLGWSMVDIDHAIERHTGMKIPEIFQLWGESGFRTMETDVLRKELDHCRRTVVATGGGVVERRENFDLLRSGGYVVYLHRDLADLEGLVNSKTRPLLRGRGREVLRKLYEERLPKYRACCDLEIRMEGTIFQMSHFLKEELRRKGIWK